MTARSRASRRRVTFGLGLTLALAGCVQTPTDPALADVQTASAVEAYSAADAAEDAGSPSSCGVSSATSFTTDIIPAGRSLWFSAAGLVQGVGQTAVHLTLHGATVQFSSGATSYSLPVPDAQVTIDPSLTTATTTLSPTGTWVTAAPPTVSADVYLSQDVFLTGVEFKVPVTFPGGISPVTWTGSFESDTPGITVQWTWGAAVFKKMPAMSALAINPLGLTIFCGDSDPPGAPEAAKQWLLAGGTGCGYDPDYTGVQSATVTTVPQPTGTCSANACAGAVDGTPCNDGNACTQADTCKGGVCVGSNPITCGASDQCHTAGTCNPANGTCSTPTITDGTPCNDGNLCDSNDVCKAGVCTAGSTVTCGASDQCHVAGTCNPSTGTCSNPTTTDGTPCNDGNACTQLDTCQVGICTGSNPLTCVASDQCHAAGICDATSGACSNPTVTDGVTCTDGNSCTQTDSCQNGTCIGSNPVTCAASDQCHVAGTCNPANGTCSNPVASNGAPCSDGNSCTQTDSCQAGICTGTNPVTCSASDQCHAAGTCNPANGTCSNPIASNGAPCSDGNSCTQTDSCQAGICTGTNPVTCSASDQCHAAGTCNPANGTCSNPMASNGAPCSDGNSCTQTDSCQAGVCTGTNPVTCSASDQCHAAGTCNPANGTCSNPIASNGAPCSDGNSCTQTDTCQTGVCTGTNPVSCSASDQCHAAGTCNPTTGVCVNPTVAEGSPCSTGNSCLTGQQCAAGVCAGGSGTCLPDAGTFGPLFVPPNPATVAPALPPTLPATVSTRESFIYNGPNAIQIGVDAGAMVAVQATGLRGNVTDTLGNPIAGATVSVASHPEFGWTGTQANGNFDVVVNGGAPLTVAVTMEGYLPVYRQITTKWNAYTQVPAIAMTPFDPAVTAVNLGSSTPQVARASQVTDSSGSRQATVTVPSGTHASITLRDGGVVPLSTASIRATEFTVGDAGPAAMPAQVAPNTAYMYAVGLTVDEAIEAEATKVTFSQPLPVYVDNFLGFPVGTLIPSGYYDETSLSWVPSTDGFVIKILGTASGTATIDIDGSGNAASTTALTNLGITTEELGTLASTYAAGATIWRVPVTHFTTWDFNMGSGPPPGSPGPGPGPGPAPPPPPAPPVCTGCQIYPETGGLGETLDVPGTGLSLKYRSDWTKTYGRTVQVPLTQGTVPAGVLGVVAQLTVAGEVIEQNFAPAPNLTATFDWDGNDKYGRPVQGSTPATVSVGYTYKSVYYSPTQVTAALAATTAVGGSHYSYYGTTATTVPSRQSVTLWQTYSAGNLGTWQNEALGLGGWGLNVLQSYDPTTSTLYSSDGNIRSTTALPTQVSWVQQGTASPGLVSELKGTNGGSMTVGPDGSIYFLDVNQGALFRVSTSGAETLIAGMPAYNGYSGHNGPGFSGDNGPATAAQLGNDGMSPDGTWTYNYKMSIAPDGSIYIADTGNKRVRRVTPDGIIRTVVGTGSLGTAASVDGLVATSAAITPVTVAAAPDGSVYIGDYTNGGRLLRLMTNGTLSQVLVVGTPAVTPSPTSKAGLGIQGIPDVLVVGPDGSVYVATTHVSNPGSCVQKISSDGTVVIVAGTPTFSLNPPADGAPATSGPVAVGPIAVASDGSIAINTNFSGTGSSTWTVTRVINPEGRIFTVQGQGTQCLSAGTSALAAAAYYGDTNTSPLAYRADGTLLFTQTYASCKASVGQLAPVHWVPLIPGVTPPEFAVASTDGSEIYAFDVQTNHHMSTHDALTGVLKYAFTYDPAYELVGVTDRNGNTTTITRDGKENLTSIVSPYGQVSTVTIGTDGYLASFVSPLGNTSTFTYDQGLLTQLVDPRGGLHQYGYNSSSYLVSDLDPAGGGWNFSRSGTAADSIVKRTSAMGLVSSFELASLPTGGFKRVTTAPGGYQTVLTQASDRSTTLSSPDGTLTTTTSQPDPRFGADVPVTSSVVKTPSGLARTTTTSVVTMVDAGTTYGVSSATTTTTVNDAGTVVSFANGASGATPGLSTVTVKTPMGRVTTVTSDTLGRPVSVVPPGMTAMSIAYDANGRPIEATQGNETTTRTYDSNGNPASMTNALGQMSQTLRDVEGRLLTSVAPDGEQTTFTYDPENDLTSLTPPGDTAHDFTYTPMDLTASYTPPTLDAGSVATTYARDLDGRPTVKTLPDGTTVSTTYDPTSGHVTSVTYPQGTISYSYVPASGKVASITSPGGEDLAFAYDGMLNTKTTWSGPVAGAVAVTYDNNFRAVGESVDDAGLPFAYDLDGLVTQAGTETITRDPAAARVTASLIGSVADSWTYDTYGRPSVYSAQNGTAVLYSENMTRDALGRIVQKTEVAGAETHTWEYSYDQNGRLAGVAEDATSVSSYAYGANDNRSSFTGSNGTVTGTYDAQDRMLSYGANSYSYTANGDLSLKTDSTGTTNYQYDAFGNLLHATLSSGTAIDYVIDGQNRRVGKKVNGTLVQGFLYRDQLKPVAQFDGNGNLVARFVYGTKGTSPDYMTTSVGTFRLLSDHLGSIRLVVNTSTGVIAEQIDYDEFGNVMSDTAPGFQPFGFAGGLYDQDTKLVRFGARDYDAFVGRWTRKDPILFDGGQANIYVYAGNDPVNRIDMTGLAYTSSPACTAAMIMAAGACLTVGGLTGATFPTAGAAACALGGAGLACMGAIYAVEITCFPDAPSPPPPQQCPPSPQDCTSPSPNPPCNRKVASCP